MSDMQEFEINQGLDPMAVLPGKEGVHAKKIEPNTKNLESIGETIDSQSYFLGEVPQGNLLDPKALLPLNSDRLIGSVNMVEKLLFEVGSLIEEEVGAIQKQQKRITFWEDRIEKNRAQIKKNEFQLKQNSTDALYDKKNRDYWLGRAEDVEIDYSHAEVTARTQDWSWLVKKYGLKNADGTEISAKSHCIEELCNGAIKNLAAEYRNAGNKYENARKDKEAENSRLVRENATFHNANDTLQSYISATYSNEIEPLQDGVLLLKELGVKLKEMGLEEKATFGQMRTWAEQFLNEFIKTNSRVPQSIVTQFRKLTSIPLPPEYC
ncbi:MAG TPA: hypothetical protein VLF94_06990 [Chlamydiales bacterium]|nr:hypothetical protein [Chlamydiales bacterium]